MAALLALLEITNILAFVVALTQNLRIFDFFFTFVIYLDTWLLSQKWFLILSQWCILRNFVQSVIFSSVTVMWKFIKSEWKSCQNICFPLLLSTLVLNCSVIFSFVTEMHFVKIRPIRVKSHIKRFLMSCLKSVMYS